MTVEVAAAAAATAPTVDSRMNFSYPSVKAMFFPYL
jgi:hypothetical protein